MASLKVAWAKTEGEDRGLVALQEVRASQSLLSIPTTALLNARTLAAFFPLNSVPSSNASGSILNAVQAVSLYLAAHRQDPHCHWAPYIRTLPADFPDHPVNVFLVHQHHPDKPSHDLWDRFAVLSSGPPTFLALLNEVVARCKQDLSAIRTYLSTHRNLFRLPGDFDIKDLLWGWLNVNTRQVWMELGLKREDNLTLAPIFDMCNHTAGSGGELKPSPSGRELSLCVPYKLSKGQEVCIQYGVHSNVQLLVEYGFVLDLRRCDVLEVRVADLVLPMLQTEGNREQEMLTALQANGYFIKDWALHVYPEPAAPSYGLIVALRLLHSAAPPDDYLHWFEILWSGQFSEKYPLIDERVKRTLSDMCLQILNRAEHHLDVLSEVSSFAHDVRTLWEEERDVALAVQQSLLHDLLEFD
ncbi:SET domain-containing protein [Dacryopinax primogenitus]|uniref:SET domain-containing protein n=1 Tax=Dacryopinax primogenitus (strain DJM 731) TaxID=1858805 RepID=M5FNZ0_DACPD|nr:SET domain-containing protein [Dacryopinax primogenitus]EJT96653.1 SET domain-containing protein [Dacryopinax primogenitus]